MTDNTRTIDAFLEDRLDQYLQDVSRLCAQPSISARHEGLEECAELVQVLLTAHGFAVDVFKSAGAPIIVGRASGRSNRTILFYNHYDVQPPEPLDAWTSSPFEPTIRDGALYARGARDDKGELIARIAAVDAVREAHDGELPCSILFVVEGQEEIGSPHIADFVEAHKADLICHGAIWEEGGISKDGPVNILGGRGVLGVECSVQTMTQDVHSGGAHIFPNAAWRLLQALNTLKGPDEAITIDGFYDGVHPPTALDLELADQLPSREALFKAQYGVDTFLLGRTGRDLRRAVFEPTCNIQGITAGYQGDGPKTIVPSKASAKLDFRLVPGQDPLDIFAKLKDHFVRHRFEDIEVKPLGGMMWPVKWSGDDPLVRLAAEAGEAVYGQPTQLHPLLGGSSPVYAFTNPLGPFPVILAGVGYWDNRQHAPDEHIRIQDFLNGARHIARIVDGFAEL